MTFKFIKIKTVFDFCLKSFMFGSNDLRNSEIYVIDFVTS